MVLPPPTSITSVAQHNTTTNNTDQYELTITKDENITDAHVEILPDNNGKYWIPKDYQVRVTADCNDGYEQSTGLDITTMDDAKQVNLSSSPTPSDVESYIINESKYKITAIRKGDMVELWCDIQDVYNPDSWTLCPYTLPERFRPYKTIERDCTNDGSECTSMIYVYSNGNIYTHMGKNYMVSIYHTMYFAQDAINIE